MRKQTDIFAGQERGVTGQSNTHGFSDGSRLLSLDFGIVSAIMPFAKVDSRGSINANNPGGSFG